MSRNLGVPGDPAAPAPPPTVASAVPPAVRSSSPGWRDPRLWVGVAIVAASVVVGARVLAAADDTVQVWTTGSDVGVGEQVTEDDLVAERVRFADADELDRYFTVDDDLPDDLTALRALGEGELLPRTAVGDADDTDAVTISLAVPPQFVPSGVGPGSLVDVRVLGETAGRRVDETADPGAAALTEVRVVAAPVADDALGAGGDRQVELAVPEEAVAAFYALLGSVTNPVITLAQVG